MSYNQGIWDKKDIPPHIIRWAENMYERKTGLRRDLQYVTWFEGDEFFTWDFGPDDPFLDTNMPFKEFIRRLQKD